MNYWPPGAILYSRDPGGYRFRARHTVQGGMRPWHYRKLKGPRYSRGRLKSTRSSTRSRLNATPPERTTALRSRKRSTRDGESTRRRDTEGGTEVRRRGVICALIKLFPVYAYNRNGQRLATRKYRIRIVNTGIFSFSLFIAVAGACPRDFQFPVNQCHTLQDGPRLFIE